MDFLSNLVGNFDAGDEEQKRVPFDGPEAEVCPECQWSNPPGQMVCLGCRKIMPGAGGEGNDDEGGELVPIPAFYQPLFQACHNVAEGQIPVEEWEKSWRSVVLTMQSVAKGVEEHLSQLREPDASVVDASNLLLTNLQGAFDALDSMGGYPENQDAEILNQGWMALVRATAGIQRSAAEFSRLQAEALETESKEAEKEEKPAAQVEVEEE